MHVPSQQSVTLRVTMGRAQISSTERDVGSCVVARERNGRGGGSGLCWLWTRTEGGRAGWNVWVGRRVERDARRAVGLTVTSMRGYEGTFISEVYV